MTLALAGRIRFKRGHSAKRFTGDDLAMIDENDVGAGDADVSQVLTVRSLSRRRDAQWKRKRVLPGPFDYCNGGAVGVVRGRIQSVHAKLDFGKNNRVTMRRVRVAGNTRQRPKNFFKNKHVADFQILQRTG